MKKILALFTVLIFCTLSLFSQDFDVIIKNGTIYDGSGGKPFKSDVGIKGDKVTAIGNLSKAKAKPDYS
ncbi:MAG TPA: hypothetical protein PKY82_14775 [Pyrinomonadaceae bacterium]|nr:hypothetical protein [Pyrinomonadaceae bacterium]